MHGGNNKMFFMGTMYFFYSNTQAEAQASWISKVITGEIKLPSKEEMVEQTAKWAKLFDSIIIFFVIVHIGLISLYFISDVTIRR